MNVPTLIAGVVVIMVIGSVIFFQIRRRKQGKPGGSCGCGCSGCAMSGSCNTKK